MQSSQTLTLNQNGEGNLPKPKEQNKMKNQKENKWLEYYYSGAIGFKIVAATISPDGFPQLICQRGRGKNREEIVLEVSRDEEGNGPGFLFGLPIPDEPQKERAFGICSDDDDPDEERDGTFAAMPQVWSSKWTDGGETEDDERSNGPTIN